MDKQVSFSMVLMVALMMHTCAALPCQDVSIPVCLDATTKLLPARLTASDVTPALVQSLPSLPNITITGDYFIGATFCEPASDVPSRENTLQILQHGAGYTRTYWSSLGSGQTMYSWVDYAAGQGYATLAIDRLCNGASSLPNGLLVCQQPVEAVVLEQLVRIARQGGLPLGPSARPFEKIVLACHSVGSDICNIYAGTLGSDADAIILSGWSNKAFDGSLTTTFGGIEPAFLAYPHRYASLASDPSYLTFSNEAGQRYLSYYGSFDPVLAHYDYLNQGTFTLGEALTIAFSQGQSPAYTGVVFSVNGNEDATYCQASAATSLQMLPGNCSAGFADGVRSVFPNARQFGYYIAPNTGHCLNLHHTAQASFEAVHDFLALAGF